MADLIECEVDFRQVRVALDEWLAATGKNLKTELPHQAKLLLQEAIALTPPMGGGVTGPAARKRGEAAVERDLTGPYGLFVGVKIKGRRKITKVFGRLLKKPVYANTRPQSYGTEPRPIYDDRNGRRFSGSSHTLDSKARGQKAPFYVDKAKLAVLRAQQKGKVGKLASGWLVALHRLAANSYPWIERQLAAGLRGRVRLQLESDYPEIEAAAEVKGAMRAELERRLRKACEIRTATLLRAIPHILEKSRQHAHLD